VLRLIHTDAAFRIGEANSLHGAMEEVNQSGDSWNVEWLDIWTTMMDMNRYDLHTVHFIQLN
jgi:hypothetical protein